MKSYIGFWAKFWTLSWIFSPTFGFLPLLLEKLIGFLPLLLDAKRESYDSHLCDCDEFLAHVRQ